MNIQNMIRMHKNRLLLGLLIVVCVLASDLYAKAPGKKQRRLIASSQNPTVNVAPVDALVYQHSYQDWVAQFSLWAFTLPPENHPFFDETGISIAVGQSGPVWFLVGAFNESGLVVRNCEIPHGTALFIPVIDTQCFNFDVFGEPLSESALADCAKDIIDLVTNVSLTIDGRPISVSQFRVSSGLVDLSLSDNNIFGLPAGHGSLVSDGYYVILEPLNVGKHTIHFTGTFSDIGWGQDVTYNVTVSPHKHRP